MTPNGKAQRMHRRRGVMQRLRTRSGTVRPVTRHARRLSPMLVFLLLASPAAAQAPAGDVSQDQAAGSIVVGSTGQEAGQQQTTTQNNDQGAGGNQGSIAVGDPSQSNDQQAATNQSIDQLQSGTFVVFDEGLHQRANQDASTLQDNTQLSGGVVVGSPSQSNVQRAETNQDIDQSMTGTFVVFGGSRTIGAGLRSSLERLNGCDVCAAEMLDAPVVTGGNLSQRDGSRQSQAGTFVVFGDLTQSASQDSSITEVNEQSVSGSIIIGSPSQSNQQEARTDQSIDQSLNGTFVVFGTLDQTADQSAETVQINDQQIGTPHG